MIHPITEDDFEVINFYHENDGRIKISEQFKHQILSDHEKARKWDELQLRNAHIDFGEWIQDTKLRELLEKRIGEIKFKFLGVMMDHYAENELNLLQELLKESKK